MEKKSVFGPSMMSGVYLGLALIAYSLLMFLLDIDRESPLMYISYVILAVGLFLAIISVRKKHLGGFIDYKGAFSAGFFAGLFASIIAGIFTFIYAGYIDPGLVEEILINAENQMIEQNPNMSDEQIETALSITEAMTSPLMMGVWGFIGNLLASTILSLIIAIFAKRENKQIAL